MPTAPAEATLVQADPRDWMGRRHMANIPQKLSPIHKHMCALRATGMQVQEVAEITGYTPQQVSNVLAHPDAEAMVNRLATDLAMRITDDVGQQIQAATGEAFQTVVHLMRNGENDRIKQVSAFDILDRGGFKPKEIHVNADIRLPAREAEVISETLEHMGRDVTPRPPLDNAVQVLTKGKKDESLLPNMDTQKGKEEAA